METILIYSNGCSLKQEGAVCVGMIVMAGKSFVEDRTKPAIVARWEILIQSIKPSKMQGLDLFCLYRTSWLERIRRIFVALLSYDICSGCLLFFKQYEFEAGSR